jgi:hypothetical protein
MLRSGWSVWLRVAQSASDTAEHVEAKTQDWLKRYGPDDDVLGTKPRGWLRTSADQSVREANDAVGR